MPAGRKLGLVLGDLDNNYPKNRRDPKKSVLEKKFKKLFDIMKERNTSLTYYDRCREFGLMSVNSDGNFSSSFDKIYYCPFTGKKLPKSLRNKLGNRLEKRDLEFFETETHPPEFRGEEWWIKRKL